MKLTEKASGPQGAPAAASQGHGTMNRVAHFYRSFQTFWHNEFSNIQPLRLLIAGTAATLFTVGASYVVLQNIDRTQTWNRVYSSGSYIGLVPNTDPVKFQINAIAKGYQVDISTVPVHMAVPSNYNWREVATIPTTGYAIQYNGRSVACVGSESEAATVLIAVKRALAPPGVADTNVHFRGDVEVHPLTTAITNIQTVQSATRDILRPAQTRLAGRAGALDGFSSAATLKQTADTKRKTTLKPLLTVAADKMVTRETKIDFTTKYISDSHMAKGTVKISRLGVPGIAKERTRLHFVNGRLVSQIVIVKRVVQSPQPQIALKGTNSGMADSNWSWPSPMFDVTSGFGWRTIGGNRNFHPGVDIGCPIGTPVFASNNGVVEDAGWNDGGYGNWVRMMNGNTIETIYGHMSRVVVHSGQVVVKGQIIGYSGATGNVTGPHLHYEVRVNGTAVPPGDYM